MIASGQLCSWWPWGKECSRSSSDYGDFVATHPPLFTEAGEPLKADHWLRVIESNFGLLHCTEVQKTLSTAQQLRGNTSVWWDNYTATRPADY
jgi:hypothetical protein